MIEMHTVASLIAETMNAYGQNILNSQEYVLPELKLRPKILKKEASVTLFQWSTKILTLGKLYLTR